MTLPWNNFVQLQKVLEDDVNELRSRVTSLQTELDNGETVQKDFVLLSQSLQQELERIRSADTQVRVCLNFKTHWTINK